MDFTLDGVDTQKGLRMTGGTPETYMRTLAVFCRDGAMKVSQIRECLDTGDLRLYTIYVHAIKSACAVIGAESLSEEARMLEAAGKKGDMGFIKEHGEGFMKKMDVLLGNVKDLLAAAKADYAPSNMVAMRAVLASLKMSLDAFNAAAIDAASDSLRDYAGVDGVEDILNNVLIGEYDSAVRIIDGFLSGGTV